MGHKILRLPDALHCAREQFEICDHFTEFTDAQRWTVAVAGTGTAAHEGPGRSRMKLFGTADADAAVLATTHELFLFTAGKSMMCEGVIQYTEVNTDDTSAGLGWADAMAATTLADTTGAVTAGSAALIYKVKDSTFWAFHTEVNGVPIASVSDTTAGGSADQTLRIEVEPRNSTTLVGRPFVNGIQLKTSSGVLIAHDIPVTSATDMDFGALIKAHHANDFNFYVDYLYAAQVR
jgi:hypothetical protein